MFTEKNVRFVRVLHYYGYWIVFLGWKYDRLKVVGMAARGVVFGACTALMMRKLAQEGIDCIINGTIMYLPTMVYILILPVILSKNRAPFVNLLNDFEDCWEFFEDDKDQEVFRRYYDKIWNIMFYMHACIVANIVFYVGVPLTVDTVAHYVFDWLSQPFLITYAHMGYLPENRTWDGLYYAVAVFGCYCTIECLCMQLGWVLLYLVIIAYCYPVLLVTEQAFRDIQSSRGDPDRDLLRKAIRSHQLLVKLNMDLKAFLGLPCALETLFVSITLTLTAFTTVTSTDVLVVSAYCSGLILHFSAGLLYCSLGQLLENKSEALSTVLYNLNWYAFSPPVQRDLNMMMRQARKTFVIDFHGNFKFNLENFMQIVSSSYSYFTILQTLTSTDG